MFDTISLKMPAITYVSHHDFSKARCVTFTSAYRRHCPTTNTTIEEYLPSDLRKASGVKSTYRALHYVSHQEALTILDPFQRWSSEAAECCICGQANNNTLEHGDATCNSEECISDYGF